MSFAELGLAETLLRAVREEGYSIPTKIQAAAIPPILEGRDVLGCAQTGTGKTAAFALPTLQRLGRGPSQPGGAGQAAARRKIRTLVLAPTRELVIQIGESFQAYGRFTGLRRTVVYGGVGQHPQVRALQAGVDVLIATPGRLLDLMQQGFIDLSKVEVLILDEADRMLDMGFIHDLRRIVAKVPTRRQTLLFSATMPEAIRQLADQWLTKPVDVRVDPVARTADKIRQSVVFIEQANKIRMLMHCLKSEDWTRTLVFTRTKHRADKVAKLLKRAGIDADAFHADKSQSARQRTLARFKSPDGVVLIATDIAARGLDIDEVSHVINYDLPVDAENYVHRIGRTGRAGAEGVALSFCDSSERDVLQSIQRLTKQKLAVEALPQGLPAAPADMPADRQLPASPRGKAGNGPRPFSRAGKPKRSGKPRRPAYAGR
jgi:ATP-dependent RNA helicase RhlE